MNPKYQYQALPTTAGHGVRPRRHTALWAVLTTVALVLAFHTHRRTIISFLTAPRTPHLPHVNFQPDDPSSLESISQRIHDSLRQSALAFDPSYAKSDMGLNVYEAWWDSYEDDLKRTWADFFDPSEGHNPTINNITNQFSLFPPPNAPLPKTIWATDRLPMEQRPIIFDSWLRKNPDWRVEWFEDVDIDKWLGDKLGNAKVVQIMESMKGKWGILRSDLWRYLVLLLEGGIYTDTDTACVRPIREWGVEPDHPKPKAFPQPFPDTRSIARQHSLPVDSDTSPGILLAIEHDCLDGYDRYWYPLTHVSRCVQFSQWTMMARPNHPIFLDAVRNGLKKYEEVAAREALGDDYVASQLDILNWFGPGAFTDAVFRYLLVRYGVHPQELTAITKPVRYGDITIMPESSFGSDTLEPHFWQSLYTSVYHGGFGRWRSRYSGPVGPRTGAATHIPKTP